MEIIAVALILITYFAKFHTAFLIIGSIGIASLFVKFYQRKDLNNG